MPIVLCVDDSETDRRLINGLLARDIDWLVQFAASAEEAYSKIEELFPHIVVTDLQLPGANGLELLRWVRQNSPDLPVILATGHGSECLAIEALEEGAASYVPKDQMVEKLRDTIEQVLGISSSQPHRERLTTFLTGEHYSYVLPNEVELIGDLVRRVQQTLVDFNFCNATKRMHVGVALEESLLNALFHGSLEVSTDQWSKHRSELRHGKLSEDVKQRLEEAPFCDRRIDVDVRVTADELKIVVRDEGPGIDLASVPSPHDAGTIQSCVGRGLVLMRNFMTRVDFSDRGNEVTMTLERPAGMNA